MPINIGNRYFTVILLAQRTIAQHHVWVYVTSISDHQGATAPVILSPQRTIAQHRVRDDVFDISDLHGAMPLSALP